MIVYIINDNRKRGKSMSKSKKILKAIYLVIMIIQIILLMLLSIYHPLSEDVKEYLTLFRNTIMLIFIFFCIAIICYILENKKHNKNESVIEQALIEPKFDISFKKHDILYLSTILNQRLPGKKEIILLIMQLITKKALDLSYYHDGNKYQYIITKRNTYFANVTKIEMKVMNDIFRNSNQVNLIDQIKKIYSNKNKEIDNIKNEIYNSSEISNLIQHSEMKAVYKILTIILSVLIFFLGAWILVITGINMKVENSIEVIIPYVLIALVCIGIAFLYTIILKKLNSWYQYNNDTYSWILLNTIFINTCLIISYIFPLSRIIQYFIMIIYIFTTLTIMIKYNTYISLSKNDDIVRNRLLSLKQYFLNMDYLKNKEFANIITYEECIMYGFLFNITIKINNEFDVLQKELFDMIKNEGKLYLKLFGNHI